MQRILQEVMEKEYLKHQTLGRQGICPIEPTNQQTSVLYCSLSDFKNQTTPLFTIEAKKIIENPSGIYSLSSQ